MQTAAQPRDIGMHRCFRRLRAEALDIDADGKCRQTRRAVARRHCPGRHDQSHFHLEVVDKIVPVFIGLEADEIVGQHRFNQFAMMRHPIDDVSRRPRRMQKEADRLVNIALAQLGAQRQEMIVLNPERCVRLAEPYQRSRHECIHLAIGIIVIVRCTDQIPA